ncbi:MAG: DoxX family membrane protein [Nanoarchaeota archaeon]
MAYEVLFLLGRLLAGGFYIMSGTNHFLHLDDLTGYAKSKKVPFAKWGVMLTGLMLLLGGVSILLGTYVKVGVLLISLFLLAVNVKMHNFWALEDDQKRAEKLNFMKNMALLGSALMWLAITAPWPLSLGL